ncbi:uncharacterized protein [Triticum aestivum]|uniref:uncharacterized protein n=1 Tax=Triticum aestivum TaxID=4565 RepID=UPI001D034EC2|nr:uncharacterized protein LOC123096705 [Triticum aestivum]
MWVLSFFSTPGQEKRTVATPKIQMLCLAAVSGSGKTELRKHETESAGVGNHHRGGRSPHTESTPQDGRKTEIVDEAEETESAEVVDVAKEIEPPRSPWADLEPADGWEPELSSLLGCPGAHGTR